MPLHPSLPVTVGHSIRRMPFENHNTCSLRSRNMAPGCHNVRKVPRHRADRRTNQAYGSQSCSPAVMASRRREIADTMLDVDVENMGKDHLCVK